MKRLISITLFVFISFSILYIPIGKAATITIPSEIRVGIMFDDPNKVSSLEKSVQVKAVSGLNIERDGKTLMTFAAKNVVHIFKTEDLMKEITVVNPSGKPTSQPSPTPAIEGGYKVITSKIAIPLSGNYHININHLFTDLKSVQSYTSKMDSIGIFAFPLYMNAGWHVCLGGYKDVVTVKKAITRLQTENAWLKDLDLDVFNAETVTNRTGFALRKDDGKLAMMVYIGDNKLAFESTKDGETITLYFGSTPKEYRGRFEIFRKSQSNFSVVNVVNFEKYLYGVVPSEIGGSAPTEALKAQAIASRTFAYNQIFAKIAHAGIELDICATQHCHVYNGKAVETAAANAAVDATAGKLVYYKGAVAKVFYYSSNGGSTEDVKYVWKSTYPYLISVKDPYETAITTNYSWQKVFSYTDIGTKMQAKGIDLGTINDIRIIEKTPAGRPFHIQVLGTKGVKPFDYEQCRTFLGLPSQLYTISTDADTNVLGMSGKTSKTRLPFLVIQSASKTTSFDISSEKVTIVSGSGEKVSVPTRPNTYTFKGKGWGHAIGMSQNGAMGMAKKGFSYTDILKHYFPGTTIS